MSTVLDRLIKELGTPSPATASADPFGEVAEILNAIPNRPMFLQILLATARRSFFADHGLILSHHRATDRWFVEASYGLDVAAIDEIKGPSWTVIRRTAQSAEGVLIPDAARNDLTRDSQSVRTHNIQAVLCAPILDAKGQVWGVIYLDNSGTPDAFDDECRERLSRFAKFCGIAIQRCDDLVRLTEQSQWRTRPEAATEEPFFDFRNPAMVKVMADLKRVAAQDVPILLLGETGVGKDYIARWIHEHSPRRERPYAEVNCTNIHSNLEETELFGIEGGTASGVTFREGRIRAADGGTVFLNEIGELPLSTQAKILRVIEHRELDRVGRDTPVAADVRFVCATRRDLKEMVKQGRFREDLYFRINPFESHIPLLRERMEDFPYFAEHILQQKCREYGHPPMRIPKTVMAQLAASSQWDGNLRELANVIGRGVLFSQSDEFSLGNAVSGPTPGASAILRFDRQDSLPEILGRFEAQVLREVLDDCGWMVIRAAARLHIPESTLRFKMKKLNVVPPTMIGSKKSR